MATSFKAIFFMASASLCLLSSFNIAHAHAPGSSGSDSDQFVVEGQVYCDTCRAQFITRISTYMEGAKVRLECKEPETDKVTYSVEGVTDKAGSYSLKVEGDHEEETCNVMLVESSDPDCAEIDKEDHLMRAAQVILAKDTGMDSDTRFANPLGFLAKERLPECTQVLKELGITSHGLI